MVRFYLWFNAVMYAVFAAATLLNPERLQRALGYYTVDNSGSSEFVVIYGGLEVGLAIFAFLAATRTELERPAMTFWIALYGAIAAFRLPSLAVYHPVRTVTYVLAAGEVVLLVAAIALRGRAGREKSWAEEGA